MSVAVKVCGLTEPAALEVAVEEGAAFLGFVFYPPSPRALQPAAFARLRALAPAGTPAVGVFVDPDDGLVARVLDAAPLDYLQLHGAETPERVAAIRERFGVPVIKAIAVAEAGDPERCRAYGAIADLFLFDARPPRRPGMLPGGNALAFDWRLLSGFAPPAPWLLAGGLHTGNLEEAVRLTGARMVDVSSGVESAPGRKDPGRLRAFLRLARTLAPGHSPGCREIPQA
jgi:phosphoribosylanthranilate isomerase